MSNARQQGAKSRLKDNSQMWKKRKKCLSIFSRNHICLHILITYVFISVQIAFRTVASSRSTAKFGSARVPKNINVPIL